MYRDIILNVVLFISIVLMTLMLYGIARTFRFNFSLSTLLLTSLVASAMVSVNFLSRTGVSYGWPFVFYEDWRGVDDAVLVAGRFNRRVHWVALQIDVSIIIVTTYLSLFAIEGVRRLSRQ